MLKVKDIMKTDLYTLYETQDLALAHSVMKTHNIRRILIINIQQELVGLLTLHDLECISGNLSKRAEVQEKFERVSIRTVMKNNVTTSYPEMDVGEAAQLLLENKYDCLPVLSKDKLVGIVTASDLLKLIVQYSSINALTNMDWEPTAETGYDETIAYY